jgi:hypothetical protein
MKWKAIPKESETVALAPVTNISKYLVWQETTYLINKPATAAFKTVARNPTKRAVKPSLARSALRSGAKAPIPPS